MGDGSHGSIPVNYFPPKLISHLSLDLLIRSRKVNTVRRKVVPLQWTNSIGNLSKTGQSQSCRLPKIVRIDHSNNEIHAKSLEWELETGNNTRNTYFIRNDNIHTGINIILRMHIMGIIEENIENAATRGYPMESIHKHCSRVCILCAGVCVCAWIVWIDYESQNAYLLNCLIIFWWWNPQRESQWTTLTMLGHSCVPTWGSRNIQVSI